MGHIGREKERDVAGGNLFIIKISGEKNIQGDLRRAAVVQCHKSWLLSWLLSWYLYYAAVFC